MFETGTFQYSLHISDIYGIFNYAITTTPPILKKSKKCPGHAAIPSIARMCKAGVKQLVLSVRLSPIKFLDNVRF